ncbi:hypothetical protein CJ030_MR7G028082 [Morella rubra]|uniref:Uncharacterized protein n=1 Tax=Morella rubra TaxID=262757 RepID=A0A6A1UZD9_9ROSI|nr:hypothetical protein CJ030_MR7G028082 [Morella rubra]
MLKQCCGSSLYAWVTFQFSPDILAAFMELQRPIRAYPTVELANKLDAEDIFCTFMGQNVVLVGPFIRQKFMLPFWCILHLIFAYDIESRAHMTKCPIMRGELMLAVARGYVIDLPSYIFLSLRPEAMMNSLAALPYNLLLTQFSIVGAAWMVRMRKGSAYRSHLSDHFMPFQGPA